MKFKLSLLKKINQLEKILVTNEKMDKNKITQEFILFSKRKKVFNSSRAMLVFINRTGSKKRDFSDKLKTIISNISKKKELSVIKKSIDELKKNEINFDQFNPFIEILIMFKDQPSAIDFLFQLTSDEIKNLHELKNIIEKRGLRTSLKKNKKEKILSICLRSFKQENIQEELTKEINSSLYEI